MSDQKNMEIDVDENKEIDLNQEFDPVAKIVSLESENEMLRKKVEMLEATYKVELEEKEKEITSLKQQLEEQENLWKTRKDFFEWRSMTWRKDRVTELLSKISELENKVRILENASPQKVTEENTTSPRKVTEENTTSLQKVTEEKEQVGGSSGANVDS